MSKARELAELSRTVADSADAVAITINSDEEVTFASGIDVTGSVTATGTSVFASLDISGDIDIDGTANLDVVDIDGAVDFGSTTAHAGNATFADNAKAIFGASSDLQIYHDGSNSYIAEGGTGNLQIQGQNLSLEDSTGTRFFLGIQGGETRLYNQGNKKVAVNSTGIDVTGSVTADGITTSLGIDVNGTDDLRVRFLNGGSFKGGAQAVTTAGDMITGSAVDDVAIRSQSNMLFAAGGATERMRIDSSGNVSIGTDSGDAFNAHSKLRIQNNDHAYLQIKANSVKQAGILLGDTDDDFVGGMIYDNSDNSLRFNSGDAERMRIDASGNVGISNSIPSSFNGGANNLVVGSGTGSEGITIYGGGESNIFFADGTVGSAAYVGRIEYSHTVNNMLFYVNNSNAMTIDASGNVGIGVVPESHYTGYVGIDFGKSGGLFANTSGTNVTGLSNNAYLNSDASAWVYKETDEASYYNQTAGTHRFSVAPSGTAGTSITWSEAMRIDASGNVGIGTVPNSGGHTFWRNLSMGTKGSLISSSGVGGIYGMLVTDNLYIPQSTGSFAYRTTDEASFYKQDAGTHIWSNAPSGSAGATATLTERMRLDASGNLLVGTTNSSVSVDEGIKLRNGFADKGVALVSTQSTSAAEGFTMWSTGANTWRFYVGWNGKINATSNTIQAISDQRFKENIRDLDDGLSKVMELRPRKFDWKEGKGADIKDARGFIAQEFEEVFPDLVGEWKDKAPEGEEPYKAVSQDLIPTLVKAIQEQQATIEALTARIAALES